MINFKAKTRVGFGVINQNLYVCLQQRRQNENSIVYNVLNNCSVVLRGCI